MERALHDVERTQRRVLRRIVAANEGCVIGRRHSFDNIRGPRDYQQFVPISGYAAIASSIERIANGASGELCSQPVTRFEETSGSTGGRKLIPYTRALHREFQRGVSAWMWDLFRNRPGVRRGRSYWSISPALSRAHAGPHSPPVGIDDDTEYLDPMQRLLARQVLAVPSTMARVRSLDALRYATLVHLLAAGDLSFISIWSPTFLTTLLDGLDGSQDQICRDIRVGSLTRPGAAWAETELPPLRPDPARAEVLTSVFAAGGSLADQLARVWPQLAVISCWGDASAAHYLPQLGALFPGVEIQPKGLISTEGIVSIPRTGEEGAVLAIRSHFLEFEDVGAADASVRLAHELEPEGRYRVILTTGGGLYRYPLHDEIQVVGFSGACPRVRLLGRTNATSDLVGEKLHEHHVRSVVDRVLRDFGLNPGFRMLVPVQETRPHYRLFVEVPQAAVRAGSDDLAAALDAGLSENPYYEHALRLGQLVGCDVWLLQQGARRAWDVYESRCLARGQRAGDIKPVALDAWTGWAEEFVGSGYDKDPAVASDASRQGTTEARRM